MNSSLAKARYHYIHIIIIYYVFGPLKKPTILQRGLKSWCDTCLMLGKKAGQLIPKHRKCSLLKSSSHWAACVYQAPTVCRALFVEATSMKKRPVQPSGTSQRTPEQRFRKTPTLRMTDPLSRAAAKPTSPSVCRARRTSISSGG